MALDTDLLSIKYPASSGVVKSKQDDALSLGHVRCGNAQSGLVLHNSAHLHSPWCAPKSWTQEPRSKGVNGSSLEPSNGGGHGSSAC